MKKRTAPGSGKGRPDHDPVNLHASGIIMEKNDGTRYVPSLKCSFPVLFQTGRQTYAEGAAEENVWIR